MDDKLTPEILLTLFEYKEGDLYWKSCPSNNVVSGTLVGTDTGRGYRSVSVFSKIYKVHRLIFFIHYGYFPSYIDHKDGNTKNNQIENLRECTYPENNQNAKIRKDNISGVKGVSWSTRERKWKVAIRKEGKKFNLGTFADLELAQLVAEEARSKYHGNFARYV